MRTLLVFNPFATSTSETTKNHIVAELSKELDLTLKPTSGRDEAIEIAHWAVQEQFDAIIGYGGDGTLNEIANGLLRDGPNLNGPILGAIPGGNANVFARNLQFSSDPLQATQKLIASIRNNNFRPIGIGHLSAPEVSRYFLFNSGIGVDAAVLAKMDQRRRRGKRVSDNMYTAIAIQKVLETTAQRDVAITLKTDTGDVHTDLKFALVINLAPWIYIGDRPVTLTPEATLDNALSIFAPSDLSLPGLFHLGRNIFGRKDPTHNNRQVLLADLNALELQSEKALWVQVDGEALVKVTEVSMRHIPDALRVFV